MGTPRSTLGRDQVPHLVTTTFHTGVATKFHTGTQLRLNQSEEGEDATKFHIGTEAGELVDPLPLKPDFRTRFIDLKARFELVEILDTKLLDS